VSADAQTFFFLLAIALPSSSIGLVLMTAGLGLLGDMDGDPPRNKRLQRLVNRFRFEGPDRQPRSPLTTGLFLVCMANAVPVLLLLRNPYGSLSLAYDLGYFAFEGLVVVLLVVAVRRARATGRDG
jgi:hypothetical protein